MTAPTHGGRREGAGRKRKFEYSKLVTVRLPVALVELIDRMEGTRADVIYRTLKKAFKA